MKILRIITRLNIGGPALQAISLTEELEKKGHEVKLITGFTSADEGTFLENEIIPQREWCSYLQREINLKMDWITFKFIRNRIMFYKPDILHTHMSKAGFLGRLAALSIKKKNRPKIVHTFHGHTFHSYFSWLKGFIFRRIEIFLAKRSDVIIAISKGQAEELNDYGISLRKIRVIPLGFDLTEFLKIEEKTITNNLNIAIIGRIADIKNYDLFLDFIKEIKKHFPLILAKIVGGGKNEDVSRILKRARDEKIPLHITNWVDHKNIYKIYEWADIVVCTSKNEGTPVSLIEAMASGRLVMSTPVGGVKDLLGRGSRGIYIYDDMLNITINRLKILLEDNAYKDLIYNARSYVREVHSLHKLVNNIESLYLKLLNEKE